MKISNLSLAILIALGTAACGGSGSSDNKPADPPKPGNPNTPAPTPPTTSDINTLVDPTGHHVVDGKDLTTTETVGTLQYIRREESAYDRTFNPKAGASSSPLLGVKLDNQNPQLTNIVLARQDLTRSDGVPVKAQFAGSVNSDALAKDGKAHAAVQDNKDETRTELRSLQVENFKNVDVLADSYKWVTTAGIANTDDKKISNNVIEKGTRDYPITRERETTGEVYLPKGLDSKNVAIDASTKTGQTITAAYEKLSAVDSTAPGAGRTATDAQAHYNYAKGTAATATQKGLAFVTPDKATVSRVGKGLVWWSTPYTAFENVNTRLGSVDANLNVAPAAQRSQAVGNEGADISAKDSFAATNGLIRIGGGQATLGQETVLNKETGKWEDHHNTTTRIFGRYHLAWADQAKGGIKAAGYNTFVGAKSFISAVELPVNQGIADADFEKGKGVRYSIGAIPGTLSNVQYGRVTTNLDLELGTGTFGDGFQHAQYVTKSDLSGVDNYFYRGIKATSVEEIAALANNTAVEYNGHALMYGIDNSFKGGGAKNLPNAFAPGSSDSQLGLGNFVNAKVNFGTKDVTGSVFNLWLLDDTKATTTPDPLVEFSGKITGNTVIGTAKRTYAAGDAVFKASFFGNKAEEIGGSFNSVKEGYGSAYNNGDWGGVFGAKQADGSGNTFQGDDGANVYTGLGN